MELNGAAIRAIRLANGDTQVELAAACGVTQSHYANLEGFRADAPDALAHRVAAALGIDDLRAIQQNPHRGTHKTDRVPVTV